MKRRFLFLVFFGFLCTACSRGHLQVHSEYLTIEDLASYHVQSPDPQLRSPAVGQRLLVSWSLKPKQFSEREETHLVLQMHFGNREDKTIRFPLMRTKGQFIYELVDDDFFEKDGIASYLAQIVVGNEVISEWKHQLWVKRISVGGM